MCVWIFACVSSGYVMMMCLLVNDIHTTWKEHLLHFYVCVCGIQIIVKQGITLISWLDYQKRSTLTQRLNPFACLFSSEFVRFVGRTNEWMNEFVICIKKPENASLPFLKTKQTKPDLKRQTDKKILSWLSCKKHFTMLIINKGDDN